MAPHREPGPGPAGPGLPGGGGRSSLGLEEGRSRRVREKQEPPPIILRLTVTEQEKWREVEPKTSRRLSLGQRSRLAVRMWLGGVVTSDRGGYLS